MAAHSHRYVFKLESSRTPGAISVASLACRLSLQGWQCRAAVPRQSMDMLTRPCVLVSCRAARWRGSQVYQSSKSKYGSELCPEAWFVSQAAVQADVRASWQGWHRHPRRGHTSGDRGSSPHSAAAAQGIRAISPPYQTQDIVNWPEQDTLGIVPVCAIQALKICARTVCTGWCTASVATFHVTVQTLSAPRDQAAACARMSAWPLPPMPVGKHTHAPQSQHECVW